VKLTSELYQIALTNDNLLKMLVDARDNFGLLHTRGNLLRVYEGQVRLLMQEKYVRRRNRRLFGVLRWRWHLDRTLSWVAYYLPRLFRKVPRV
jgi:hypothetical protein